MQVNRGDIVLVDYFYSDRSGSKLRPCLVVQNDSDNQRLDDTIVVAISSNTSRAGMRTTQVIIRVGDAEGKQSGLLFDSAVQCENLVTIDRKFVKRKIGTLADTIMSDVDQALKTVLSLT